MSSALADVVDLAVQVERDVDLLPAELHRRDRLLFTEPGSLPVASRERMRAWLGALRAQRADLPGKRLAAGYRLLVAGLAFAGALLGGVAATVVFRYDGSRPVNVVHVLAVLVLPQVALLALLGVVMLPGGWLRRVPGAAALQESLAALSPGRVVRVLLRHLPEPIRDRVARPDSAPPLLAAFGHVWKWAALFGAQSFAAAFNLAAALTALYLVTFSDLAFAWSTTLTPNAARVHEFTGVVAAPWRALLPEAVPTEDLIRATLYYRAGPAPTAQQAGSWGGWWPFLLAALVTYGVLPRLVLLLGTGLRLRQHLRQALVDSPAARSVLERLGSRWVTTQATDPEAARLGAAEPEPASVIDAIPGAHGLVVVNWGGLELDEPTLRLQTVKHWNRELVGLHRAGGRCSLAEEEQAIAALARSAANAPIVVLVKAWEPPLLEFTDFLRALRRACGPGRRLVVVPLGLGPGGEFTPATPAEAMVWRRRVRSLSDPGLSVFDWPEPEGTRP